MNRISLVSEVEILGVLHFILSFGYSRFRLVSYSSVTF